MSSAYVSKIKIGNGEEVDIKDEAAVRASELFDLVYPVDSIYMSVNNVNPSTFFGGTWESWGTGKVPVGVDATQTEFDTVEKSGGSKYIQAHNHSFTQPTISTGAAATTGSANKHRHNVWRVLRKLSSGSLNVMVPVNESGGEDVVHSTYADAHTHSIPAHSHTASGGAVGAVSGATTGATGNLQPYITCYMWKRTA